MPTPTSLQEPEPVWTRTPCFETAVYKYAVYIYIYNHYQYDTIIKQNDKKSIKSASTVNGIEWVVNEFDIRESAVFFQISF